MALASVIVAGDVVGTLHSGYACGECGQELGVLWAATPLGRVPVAADLAARPVANCPACSAPVDALAMFGPGPDTTEGSKRHQ